VSQRLRIAQLAPPYEAVPPARYGGTERVVWALTEELVRRGHEVTLFASGDSRTSAHLVPIVDRALWQEAEPQDGLAYMAVALDDLYGRAHEFDLIHSHDQLMVLPLARLCPGTPTVTTLHGRLDRPDYQHLFQHFREQPLVSISNSQRVPFPEANWLATVYNGVCLDAFPFQPRHEGYLAFVGRISPDKGVDSAIRVARRVGLPLKLAARMPLRQAGNPEAQRDWEYYEQAVKPLLAEPGIEYLGELADEDKNAVMAGAAALLFPIDWPEPFGLVMVEALACGTPVLAFRRGSTPEVIEPGVNGFLAADEDELVSAVMRLPELDRARCRAGVQERFSAAVMASGYEQAYAKALGTACASPGSEGPPGR